MLSVVYLAIGLAGVTGLLVSGVILLISGVRLRRLKRAYDQAVMSEILAEQQERLRQSVEESIRSATETISKGFVMTVPGRSLTVSDDALRYVSPLTRVDPRSEPSE